MSASSAPPSPDSKSGASLSLADTDTFELERLREELTKLRREADDLKGRVASAGKIGGTSGRELLDLREALNKKDKEILNLRDQLTAREKELLEVRDQHLRTEREKADQADRLVELERSTISLRAELAERTSDHERELTQKLTQREREITEERSRATQTLVASHAERLARIEEGNTKALAEKDALLHEREASWTQERASLTAQIDAHKAEIERAVPKLTADLTARTQQRDHLQAEVTRLAAELTSCAGERDQLRAEAARLAEGLAACTKERDDLRAESMRLDLDLTAEKERALASSRRWAEDRASLERGRKALLDALAQIDETLARS